VDRAQKEKAVAALAVAFEECETVVVTHYKGLTVAEITELRQQMSEAGASFRVTKNTLALRALNGTRYEQLSGMFAGPTAMATSQDPVAAAKVVHNFAKDNDKLIIIGGAMGDILLDVAGVEALAKMPSLDESRAKLVGILSTPATRVATVLQAPASALARVTAAYAEKG